DALRFATSPRPRVAFRDVVALRRVAFRHGRRDRAAAITVAASPRQSVKPDTTDVVSSMSMRTGWVLSACMFALAGCDGGSAEGSDPQGTDSGDPTAGESTSDTDDLPSPYADGTAGPDDMPSL